MSNKEISKNKKKIISIPPVYFLLCIATSTLLFFVLSDYNQIPFPFNLIIGLPLMIFGTYLILAPHFLLEKNNTAEDYQRSTCVITTGVYRYSRNPMYLGFFLFLLGFSTTLTNLPSLFLPILFFSIINWMFIPYEEEKMKDEIGEEYLDYKKKVRRWI